MKLRQRRDKVVLFRLTEHEHELLEDLCAARGGRSLSEYVRVALLNPSRTGDGVPLQERIGSIEHRLSLLEAMHAELARRVLPLLAAPRAEASQALNSGNRSINHSKETEKPCELY